jgi:hypothetical protein
MNRYAEFAEPWRQHEMSMDVRHAGMVGRFLRGLGGLKSVVEVGCCYGVSTAEVLDACEQSGAQCTLIDLAFTQSVVKMLAAACNRVRVSMASDHSAAVLGKYLSEECVLLLDGDHRRVYMELEDEILGRCPPRALILHGVTSHRLDCDGPRWMLHRWQALGYRVAIDYMPREGERTDRGLAILCSSERDGLVARLSCPS